MNAGYWTGDPGDPVDEALHPNYGDDQDESFPPADEIETDPPEPDYAGFADAGREKDAGIYVNGDEELEAARSCLDDIDFEQDDGNFGIDVYCSAVTKLTALMSSL
jgi:hypothetical protein